jgi:ABC-2 type transport system ATP-binding protein
MDIVQVERLTKHYGKIKAVDDISFNVENGEIFGMLGPNGAGKTTTIECMTGLRSYDHGNIRVLDMDPGKERSRLYNSIGVQLQETSFQDKIRVFEICKLFESFYIKPYPYEKLLERFELGDKKRSYVSQLSGGQRQRLSIILALIPNPKIVFLDELTTGLDPKARRSMWMYIRELKEEGKTVFLTTHYMEEAEDLCDRVCIINKGRIAALDTVRNVIGSCGINNRISFITAEKQKVYELLSQDIQIRDLIKMESINGRFIVTGTNDHIPGRIAAVLENNNIEYQELIIKRPELEDAFLQLTGRRIEEDCLEE